MAKPKGTQSRALTAPPLRLEPAQFERALLDGHGHRTVLDGNLDGLVGVCGRTRIHELSWGVHGLSGNPRGNFPTPQDRILIPPPKEVGYPSSSEFGILSFIILASVLNGLTPEARCSDTKAPILKKVYDLESGREEGLRQMPRARPRS